MALERQVADIGASELAAAPAGMAGRAQPSGFIDQIACGDALGGLFLLAWANDRSVDRTVEPHPISLEVGGVQLVGRAFVGFFERADVPEGVGLIIHVPHLTRLTGALSAAQLAERGGNLRLQASIGMELLSPAEMFTSIAGLRLIPQGAVAHFGAILERPRPGGGNALADAGLPIHVEVDEVIIPASGSAVLLGWRLDPLNLVESLHLRCGWYRSPPIADRQLALPRPDVLEAFGQRYGLNHPQHGFLAYAETDHPAGMPVSSDLTLEVRLHNGSTWFRQLPIPQRRGLAGMLRVLGAGTLPEEGLQKAMAEIIAPPLLAMNRARLARPCQVSEHDFGEPPAAPLVSIVIPLYGRIDLLHHQLAQFSANRMAADEIIYVLDDPRQADATLRLARTAHAMFQLPFRLLVLGENRGFGPASNIGMRHARGEYVYFLNSDVLPITQGWTAMLAEALQADPSLGCVGPVLCFADGSVQHMGMVLEPRAEANNWGFPRHTAKGRRLPSGSEGLIRVPLITGAALMMRREVVSRLGGFDEQYAIGDFEDVDLCVRAGKIGLGCAVHAGVSAYHLERQSQGDSSALWRSNLTLLNGWLFHRAHPNAMAAASRPTGRGVRMAREPQHAG